MPGFALETLCRDGSADLASFVESVSAGDAAKSSLLEVPAPAGDAVPELEGEWAMTACNRDGMVLDEGFLSQGRRVTRGKETTMFFGKQVFMKANFSVDRRKDPKAIDYVLTHGPSKGKCQFGIWAIEGGTLKVSFSTPGMVRPATFATGKGFTVTNWKRVKP